MTIVSSINYESEVVKTPKKYELEIELDGELHHLQPASSPTSTSSSVSASDDDLLTHKKTPPQYVSPQESNIIINVPQNPLTRNGNEMISALSSQLSDQVFLYTSAGMALSKSSANMTLLQSQSGGSGLAICGALSEEMKVAAFFPSQNLPLFTPILHRIMQKPVQENRKAIFHIPTFSLGRDQTISTSHSQIYQLRPTGMLVLNSTTLQESVDMTIISHAVSQRLNEPLVHFYNGVSVGSTVTKLQHPLVQEIFSMAANSRNMKGVDRAQVVQDVMNELSNQLNKQYNVFEYYGPADATHVVLIMGDNTSTLVEAMHYCNLMNNEKIAVVQVRLFHIWSHKHFAEVLPLATLEKITVLEKIAQAEYMSNNILTRSVQSFFFSSSNPTGKIPIISGGSYGDANNGVLSRVMADNVLTDLIKSELTQPFFFLNDGDKNSNCAMRSISCSSLTNNSEESNIFVKEYAIYGFESSDVERYRNDEIDSMKQTMHRTLAVLNSHPSLYTAAQLKSVKLGENEETSSPLSVIQFKTSCQPLANSNINKTNLVILQDLAILLTTHGRFILQQMKSNGLLIINSTEGVNQLEDLLPECLLRLIAEKQVRIVFFSVPDEQSINFAIEKVFFDLSQVMDTKLSSVLLLKQYQDMEMAEVTSKELMLPYDDWLALVVGEEEEEDVAPGFTIRPHQIFSGLSISNGKKRKLNTSDSTSLALTFPDHFSTELKEREGVTTLVELTKWERLTPLDYDRNVFHLEMDIRNTGLKYSIGEALAVYAHNSTEKVLSFCDHFKFQPEEVVVLPNIKTMQEERTSVFHLFAQILDIFGKPGKKFYTQLAEMLSGKDQEKIQAVVDNKELLQENIDETLTFADIFYGLDAFSLTLTDLIRLVPRIKPRHYSIASSMKLHPDSVHLLVVVHDWKTPKGVHRVGQCTAYLSALQVGDKLSVSVCHSVMKLPVNHTTPVIMSGLGTGMAPFRAFLQERHYLKTQGHEVGPMVLYFGSRYKAKEYLYGSELDQYEKDGLITKLQCAFSRDQKHKVYIQDKINEDKELLHDLMVVKQGHFYLCGPTWPVADVRDALISSFTLNDFMPKKKANDYIEQLKESGRYVLEVY